MIRLEEIDPENWRLGLKVSEAQQHYVSDSAGLLARAYAYRNSRSNAFVIYHDDIPVGMALYYDWDEMSVYDFSQLFIDERYQGRGFGIGWSATANLTRSFCAILTEMKPRRTYMKSWASI